MGSDQINATGMEQSISTTSIDELDRDDNVALFQERLYSVVDSPKEDGPNLQRFLLALHSGALSEDGDSAGLLEASHTDGRTG